MNDLTEKEIKVVFKDPPTWIKGEAVSPGCYYDQLGALVCYPPRHEGGRPPHKPRKPDR